MEDASGEHSCYLDLETVDTILVTDETRRQLEEIYEGKNTGEEDDDVDIEPILAGLDIPDWQKEALLEADRVERDFGVRYIAIPAPTQTKPIATWKTLSPQSRTIGFRTG